MKYTLNQKIFCEYVEIVQLVKNMNKYIAHISLLNKPRSMYIFLVCIFSNVNEISTNIMNIKFSQFLMFDLFLKKYVMIVHFIDWFTYPLVSFVLHLNTATNQHMTWSSCINIYVLHFYYPSNIIQWSSYRWCRPF